MQDPHTQVTRRKVRHSVRLRNEKTHLSAISLFSSAGIGDLGLQAAGFDVVVANELLSTRVDLYKANFGHSMIQGDIREAKKLIMETACQRLGGKSPFLLYATPPCQGMSSNGMGKLKSEVASGRRDTEDERNRLIIPTMDITCALRPLWLLLENVPSMESTVIRTRGDRRENIIEYITRRLGPEYTGKAEVIACEDYGVPQRRKRLITIFTRDSAGISYFRTNGGSFFSMSMREPKITLRDAIGHLPPLDARRGKNSAPGFNPYHYVPVMSDLKHLWVRHTRMGDTAFNNQCINPDCRSDSTPGHKDIRIGEKWVSSKTIPIYCNQCGDLLPRPHVIEDGTPRLLKGFHSAYRRMTWDEPARTLTQNFIYEASDNKLHPTQHRVLSIYEAMVIQTISRYKYVFAANGDNASAARIAEIIGESVPPYLIEKLCAMMMAASRLSTKSSAARSHGTRQSRKE